MLVCRWAMLGIACSPFFSSMACTALSETSTNLNVSTVRLLAAHQRGVVLFILLLGRTWLAPAADLPPHVGFTVSRIGADPG